MKLMKWVANIAVPYSEEKYISFSKTIGRIGKKESTAFEMRFLDTYKFLGSSLDMAVASLAKTENRNDPTPFERFPNLVENVGVEMFLKKGVFPYEYVDSLEKLSETCLPPIDRFYSSLKDEDITEEDYVRAQKVWDNWNVKI
jgi:hypothetical protein